MRGPLDAEVDLSIPNPPEKDITETNPTATPSQIDNYTARESLPETIEESIVLQDLDPTLAELDLPDLEPTPSCSFAVANVATNAHAQWTQPSTSTHALNP